MFKKLLGVALSAAVLGGCASAYGPSNWTGGYSESLVSGDVWSVRFGGNGYTTQETVQTYWLYHCADFALSKGFAGFQILTPVDLSRLDLRATPPGGAPVIVKAGHGGGGGGHTVYIYGGGGAVAYKPTISAQIRLLKPPVVQAPGRVFDAAKLKTMLEPQVNGEKCGGNVCPYVHKYLYPESAEKTS
jgi:hypothetical protein